MKTPITAIFVLSLTMLFSFDAAAIAQDDELVDMVIEFLADSDPDMRSLAFEKVRENTGGPAGTARFAAKLKELPPDGQVGLISALATRGDRGARPAVLEMLEAEKEPVRVAAIRALSKLGEPSDCTKLASMVGGKSADADAARISLVQIQGEGITGAIAAEIENAPTDVQVGLIDVLASRRALDTIPKMLELAVGEKAEVRAAAMKAVGAIGGPDHIPGMVRGVLKADGKERTNAERNLTSVCNRIEDRDARAQALLDAIRELDESDQTKMLVTLGRVGGKTALGEIEKAIASEDRTRHSRGISALASWPDSSVAEKLEELAYNEPHINHQLTALRALIRVAPLADGREEAEKLALLQRAMDMSVRVADRKYALQRASAIRIPETLRWVLPFVDDPRYAEQACLTIVELAHIRDLRDDNKAEFHAALDKVMATTKDATVLDRADRYKKGRTWVRSE